MHSLVIQNTAVGVGNSAALNVTTDTGGGGLAMASYSSTFTPAGFAFQKGAALYATQSGGLSFGAMDAAGVIRFYTGNAEHGRMFASGGFSWGDTTDPGATNFRVAGTSTLIGQTTHSADVAWANNTGFGLLGSDGVRFLSYTTAGGALIGSGAAKVNCAVPFQLKGYTVGTLPAGTQGFIAYATDLLAPTFLAAAVGGGAVVGPVFYNGAGWVTM